MKIVIFTGNRADASLLQPIADAILTIEKADLHILAGGAHLLDLFGSAEAKWYSDYLYSELVSDYADVEINVASGISSLISSGAEFLREAKPGLLIVYADRIETFAIALAAFYNHVPMMHIEGGDVTIGGTYDDQQRHMISLMADYHCVTSLQAHAHLEKLGVDKDRIGYIGVPSLRTDDLSIREVQKYQEDFELGSILGRKIALITVHPIPRDLHEGIALCRWLHDELLVSDFDVIIWTNPNSDPGSKQILEFISSVQQARGENRKRFLFVQSLGAKKYFGLLNLASSGFLELAVLGNSSSITKETGFYRNVVSICFGSRQMGRHLNGAVMYQKDFQSQRLSKLVKQQKKLILSVNPPEIIDSKVEFLKCLSKWKLIG